MEMSSRPQVPGYVLLDQVGAGGHGEVWRARRDADDLLVALKVMTPGAGELAGALREAGVLARVRHPHLLHLYDVVPVPDGTGATSSLALAVQFAGGGSLAQVLSARHHLTPGELVTLLVPLAGALAQLHAAGIVHGDVAPGNVLFLTDGMPMLADVGVSRLVGESDRAVHGTDGMISPETLEGFLPGPEADIYAMGALAWWCLTGSTPGWVGTRPELADLVPDVPEGMRDLVIRTLSPEPEDRPDAQEVAGQVLGLADAEPIEVAPDVDPGISLTRRLRAVARVEHAAQVDPLHARRWWGARRGPANPPRHRLTRSLRRDRGAFLTGFAPLGVILLLGLLAAAVATVLVTGAGAESGTAARDGPVFATGPAYTTGPSPTTAAGSTRPGAGGTGHADQNTTQAEAVVQRVVDARARAWSRTEPDLLDAGLAPGSPAMRADRVALREAVRRGVAYEGVGFRVVDATVDSVDSTGHPPMGAKEWASARRLRVAVTVQRTAISADTDAGEQATTDITVDDVTLELRRTDAGWRIWSWH